jgi:hypothetical protein
MTKLTPTDGVYSAAAWRADAAAIDRLLAPLPAPIAASVRQGLAANAGSFTGMRHDGRRAFYVRTDTDVIELFTLPECTPTEAAAIWQLLGAVEPRVTVASVVAAYRDVTGHALGWAH